jgi:hypothetical protein
MGKNRYYTRLCASEPALEFSLVLNRDASIVDREITLVFTPTNSESPHCTRIELDAVIYALPSLALQLPQDSLFQTRAIGTQLPFVQGSVVGARKCRLVSLLLSIDCRFR